MRISFHTNLDLAQEDVKKLSFDLSNKITNDATRLPRKGDYIQFEFDRWNHDTKRSEDYHYQLEVVSIVHNYSRNSIRVELHIPRAHQAMSIADWEKWFKKHRYNRDW